MRSKPRGPCLNLSPYNQPSLTRLLTLLNAPPRSKLSFLHTTDSQSKPPSLYLNLATCNHTVAAALWACLLGLPLTSALAACPLPSPSFGEYDFHNTGSSDSYSIAMLYSFDSEGVVETLRESRCEVSGESPFSLGNLLDSELVPTAATHEILIVFLPVLLATGGRQDRRRSNFRRDARFRLRYG
ncbi:hypothetical protein SDJN03_27400, partial [Cucurbita argyrosperma subsp. sororia]